MRKPQSTFARILSGAVAFGMIAWAAAGPLYAAPAGAASPTQYSETVVVLMSGGEHTLTRNGPLMAIDRPAIPAHRDSFGLWPDQPAQRTIVSLITHRAITRLLPNGAFDCAQLGSVNGDIGDTFADPTIVKLLAAPRHEFGQVDLNGTPAEMFETVLDGQTFTVWHDRAQGIVLKVTGPPPSFGTRVEPGAQRTYYEVKRFAIGPVDQTLFALPETCRRALVR